MPRYSDEDKATWRRSKRFLITRQYRNEPPPKVGTQVFEWKILNAWISRKNKLMAYEAQCSCGHIETYLNVSNLRSGGTKSCKSCSNKTRQERVRIGSYKHLYNQYGEATVEFLIKRLKSMIAKSKRSIRGLEVDKGWIDYPEIFIKDMLELEGSLDPDLLPDRIDTYGHYAPGNIEFVTHKENTRNQRNSTFLKFKGEQIQITKFIEQEFGIAKKEDNIELYSFVQKKVKQKMTGEMIIRLVNKISKRLGL